MESSHFGAAMPRRKIIKVPMRGPIERILKNLKALTRPELLVEELARLLISSPPDLGLAYLT
jgi:hypothetical protein